MNNEKKEIIKSNCQDWKRNNVLFRYHRNDVGTGKGSRTLPDREHRAIAGLSMGVFQA